MPTNGTHEETRGEQTKIIKRDDRLKVEMRNPSRNTPSPATPRITPLALRNLNFKMGGSLLKHNEDLIPMESAITTDHVTPTTRIQAPIHLDGIFTTPNPILVYLIIIFLLILTKSRYEPSC